MQSDPGAPATQVVVHDPNPCFRQGLVAALTAHGFVAEAAADRGSGPLAPTGGVTALLVTVRGIADLALLATLLQKHAGVIALVLIDGPGDEQALYTRALAVGAHAALQRDAPPEAIVHALDGALQRQVVLPVDVVRRMVTRDAVGRAAVAVDLDETEKAWLAALMRGATVRKLALQSGYSERQLHRRLQQLYRRLGATTRTEAVARAAALGFAATASARAKPGPLPKSAGQPPRTIPRPISGLPARSA